MGFEKLIDLLIQWIRLLKPFCVVTPCKEGVVCLWGKEVRQIANDNGMFGTGFHWIIPFGIEQVYDLSMATRLAELQAQALVTKDGKSVIAGLIITYRVCNVSKAIFSVWDAFSAAQDACQANFAQAVLAADYDYLRTDAFADSLTEACRVQGFKYGFEIERVRLHELAPARTFRLIGNGLAH